MLEQRADAGPVGTNISIKNLFYNLPARRNFLKSIAVETKHIVEEFLRQAMANPHVEFVYHNNGQARLPIPQPIAQGKGDGNAGEKASQ